MIEKLGRDRLLQLLNAMANAKKNGLTESQADEMFLTFCAGCPDPVKARWLYVECLDPMTDEELVDRALSMPLRRMADIPASEFPLGHPLRTMAE